MLAESKKKQKLDEKAQNSRNIATIRRNKFDLADKW